MENNVNQIANNYITLPRARSRRSNRLRVSLGVTFFVLGVSGFYWGQQANAQVVDSTTGVNCVVIKEMMERDLYLWSVNINATVDALGSRKNQLFEYNRKDRESAADWATIYIAKCK